MPNTIANAVASTHPSPSPAQRDAGNYRKGKLRLHGLEISIENPKGTRRRPEWKPLACHYGYINRTEGRDGDHVDVFIGPNPSSELVFVVDQVTESGKRFDEHKVMLGFTSKAKAKAGYLANYQAGWKCGPITAMTIEQFKTWLRDGDTTKRVAMQVSKYDKSGGLPSIPGTQPGVTHQVGETKSFNGTTYRLNENHRWELANPEEGSQGGVPGADPAQQPPDQSASPQPSPAADPAARNAFTASRLHTVHPEIGGLLRAIHESPHFQQSGEFASYDVHKKVAGDLYHTLSKHAGKEIAGGQVVDLGQGRVGFASEAGSIAVWPADASGRHQITYTNKTGIVGRAMAGQKGGGDGEQQQQGQQEQPAEAGGDNQPSVENEPEAPPRVAKPIAPPPLPAQSGAGGNPFRQEPTPPAKPQQNPSPAPSPARAGGKLPDEQAYDDSLTPAKPRPPHVALRERANQWKEKAVAARDAWTQAVEDREHPKRIRALKQKFTALREAYNDHERHARRAEGEHKARLRESGKATKERMKSLGIGPYAGKGRQGGGKSSAPSAPPAEKSGKSPPAEKPIPLIDHAEQNPGKGDVPTPTPEALEMGKLPMESQRAGSAAQTFLKSAGLSVTPENHKAIQHAIRRGWVKNKGELRAMLKTAKKIHERGNLKDENGGAASDHAALREAIRRKGNRERRESWAKIVKQKADHWEMPAKEFHDTASQYYKEFVAPHKEREDVKDELRNMVGVSANKLRQIEERGGKGGKGGDYSNVKGLDNAVEYLKNNFPHLIENENPEQTAWEMLKEGKKPPPGKTSEEFMQKFEEALSNGYTLEKNTDVAPMSQEEIEKLRESGGGGGGGNETMLPFAKTRKGVVIRY